MVDSSAGERRLSREQFDRLRRDPNWRLRQIYFNTFAAVRPHDPEASGSYYLIRGTADPDAPWLLLGPIEGDPFRSPWPSPARRYASA